MDEIRDRLAPIADPRALEELNTLSQEPDPELYHQGLLVLGAREQQRGHFAAAAAIYESAAAGTVPEIAERAQRRLAALSGQGAVAERAEILVSQFGRQATDYRTIVPMIAGSALFQMTRAATLAQLAGSEAWFARGTAARLLSNLSGFAVEVPAFSLLSRGLMDFSGEPVSWSSQALRKDLASAALTLGALKSFAAVGTGVTARLPQLDRFTRAAIPQVSVFSGMMLAHHVEAELGLRPKSDGATAVADTLAAMASLGAGAHLAKSLLGPKFGLWESQLQWRNQNSPVFSPRSVEPSLAWAFAAPGETLPLTRPMAMSTPKDKSPDEPFHISLGRIRSGAETHAPAEIAAMPFPLLVQRNNLYGSRTLALPFERSGQDYVLGAKISVVRDYKNLHESASGKPDMTLVNTRDGYLHHRQKVENLRERVPNFINLFRNERIRDQQAVVDLRDGQLWLRNATKENLVWTLQGTQWQAVGAKGLPLKDGAWVVLGKDPANLPENTLDPREHTVLKVELHRPRSKGPERWSLIEYEAFEEAQFQKIPTIEGYVAALLGQSLDFTTWRFRPLWKALETAEWKAAEARDLLGRVYRESPILGELNLGSAAEVLSAAQRNGWSKQQIQDLLFHEALAGKNGMTFLNRLPKLLEESSALGVNPRDLSELLVRLAKYDGNFLRSLEALPAFLAAWKSSSGGDLPWAKLLDYLDRAKVSIEPLHEFFPKIPGGEEAFLETVARLLPEIEERIGYRGGTFTELSVEILTRMAERMTPESPPSRWVSEALETLPPAFDKLIRLGFGYSEQRQILLQVAEEQGPKFTQWWKDAKSERTTFESYLGEKSGLPITGLLGLSLGLLGLHELNPEILKTLSPGFMLGASLFFGGNKGNRSMSPTFALPERIRARLSRGPEKIERLLILARKMEAAGYFREARERFEMAVDAADRFMNAIGFRDPESRGLAGEAHHALGSAYFELAAFWDRREAGRELVLDFYKIALDHLEPLGRKSLWDVFLISNARTRLQRIHFDEARHWAAMDDAERSGKHYEAAGDFAIESEMRLELWGKALMAYVRAEPVPLAPISKVLQKIHSLKRSESR